MHYCVQPNNNKREEETPRVHIDLYYYLWAVRARVDRIFTFSTFGRLVGQKWKTDVPTTIVAARCAHNTIFKHGRCHQSSSSSSSNNIRSDDVRVRRQRTTRKNTRCAPLVQCFHVFRTRTRFVSDRVFETCVGIYSLEGGTNVFE